MSINIIWDFDGVIADTEMIWVENRRVLLNENYNLNWDIKTAYQHLGGTSDVTKDLRLKELGIYVDDAFWKKALEMDYVALSKGAMMLTENVKDVLSSFNGRQCVATGGILSKTKAKIKSLGLEEYFDDSNLFCADMVAYGKPEPDVFLLAQESMGWKKEECVVIEDSFAGMIAGKRAGIRTIAYVGNAAVDKEKYLQGINNMGIVDIFDDMLELKNFLNTL